MNQHDTAIFIEAVKGGFILTYPSQTTDGNADKWETTREVFSTAHKLNQKLKEVIANIATVGEAG